MSVTWRAYKRWGVRTLQVPRYMGLLPPRHHIVLTCKCELGKLLLVVESRVDLEVVGSRRCKYQNVSPRGVFKSREWWDIILRRQT